MTSGGSTSAELLLSSHSTALIFLRVFNLLELRQESVPERERSDLISRLRPLRDKLIHNTGMAESEWASANSAIAEMLDYLRLLESSSLGSGNAQTNRLLSAPKEINDVLASAERHRRASDAVSLEKQSQGNKVHTLITSVPAEAVRSGPSGDLGDDITLAMTGNLEAIQRLLAVVRPLAIRYCRARIGREGRSFASADDAAQEVCLAVLKGLPSYRDQQERPFLAFVYGIAAHKVADVHRASASNHSKPVSDVPDGPEQRALRGELSREMTELLKILPEKQREILLLRIVVGLSAEETATALGSTPGAVRVAMHRALTKLRKSMTPEQLR